MYHKPQMYREREGKEHLFVMFPFGARIGNFFEVGQNCAFKCRIETFWEESWWFLITLYCKNAVCLKESCFGYCVSK